MYRSTYYPKVYLKKYFKRLTEIFESTYQYSKCEIKLEYETMKMKYHDDPEIFINTLEKLERQMKDYFNINILDEYIITKLIKTLPKEY